MASSCLLDTTAFITALFPREKHHNEWKQIISSAEEAGSGRCMFTDCVLNEVVTFVRKRKSAVASVEVLDAKLYSPNLIMVKVEGRHFEAGLQLFGTYEGLSFTDAVSVAVMRDLDTRIIYSFDSDGRCSRDCQVDESEESDLNCFPGIISERLRMFQGLRSLLPATVLPRTDHEAFAPQSDQYAQRIK